MNAASAYSASRATRARRTAGHAARRAGEADRVPPGGALPASVEVDDLIQAGMLGLLEAASNYAANRGASFETYAGIRIRGAMIDALRKLDWAPRSVHRKARAVAAACARSRRRSGARRATSRSRRRWVCALDEYH